MDFVVTKNFKSPYAVATGVPHKPTALKTANFKKGQIIKGDIKKDDVGNNAFVMYRNTIVVPLDCVRQVLTKEVDLKNGFSNATGSSKPLSAQAQIIKVQPPKEEVRKKYIDAIIIGGILGFVATYYAEKKGYVQPEEKNKMIGVALGSLAGLYLVYRFKK